MKNQLRKTGKANHAAVAVALAKKRKAEAEAAAAALAKVKAEAEAEGIAAVAGVVGVVARMVDVRRELRSDGMSVDSVSSSRVMAETMSSAMSLPSRMAMPCVRAMTSNMRQNSTIARTSTEPPK